jgi:hypothetical protein
MYGGRCPAYACGEEAGSDPASCDFCRGLVDYFEHQLSHGPHGTSAPADGCGHCVNEDGLIRRQSDTLDDRCGWQEQWGEVPTPEAVATAREFLAELGPAWSEGVGLTGDGTGGLFLENSLVDEPGELSVDIDEQGALVVVLPELDDNPDGKTFTVVTEAVSELTPFMTGTPPMLYGARPKQVTNTD